MRTVAFAFLIVAAAAQTGSQVPGFKIWRTADLKALDAGLKTSGALKTGGQGLGNWGHYQASISKREADGEAEVHEKVTDFFVAVSGEASLVVGGAIPNAKSVGPGESRGPAIVGGARHEMRPGDIAHIPANTPHQFLVPRSFTYYVVKVNAR